MRQDVFGLTTRAWWLQPDAERNRAKCVLNADRDWAKLTCAEGEAIQTMQLACQCDESFSLD